MRRYQSFGDLPLGAPRRVVAIGTFDGVHVGHQAVIRQAIARAAERRPARDGADLRAPADRGAAARAEAGAC